MRERERERERERGEREREREKERERERERREREIYRDRSLEGMGGGVLLPTHLRFLFLDKTLEIV